MDDRGKRSSEPPHSKSAEPPLHCAARLGDADAIRSLAAAGADLNGLCDLRLDPGSRPRRATPLMVAAGSGEGASADTVALLLKLGADPKLEIDGESAATFACAGLGWGHQAGGDAERLRLLLGAGSPLPSDAEDANRLLCEAAASGDPRRVQVLLSHGLSPKGHFDAEEARRRHREMMKQMARYREDQPNPFASLPQAVRDSMADSMREMDDDTEDRWASAPSPFEIPLFRAAESGSAECVRLLLKAGADPRARDSSRRTAMYCARSVEAIRELQEAGLSLEDADEFEWSPLCSALAGGEEALPQVRALIEAGANVNATHDHGYTVFMSAVGSSRLPEVLRLLVASGADVHATTDRGYNAFHAAIDVNGEANAEESVRARCRT